MIIMIIIIIIIIIMQDVNNKSIIICIIYRASDISRKKSKISRDFPGQIRGKIARFRGIFAGKKSKFAEQSADFAGFSREKSQNSQKKRPISREISGGNFAKKQSVKNSRFRWVFLENFAKIDQYCVDMTSVGERFF